jgi:hypothetical protein
MDPASSNHRTEQLSTGRTSCGQGGQKLMLPLILSFFLQVSFISSEEIAFLTVRPHVGILTPTFHVRVPIRLECCSKGLSCSQVHEYVVHNVHPVHAILCYPHFISQLYESVLKKNENAEPYKVVLTMPMNHAVLQLDFGDTYRRVAQ